MPDAAANGVLKFHGSFHWREAKVANASNNQNFFYPQKAKPLIINDENGLYGGE